jgi:RAP domain
MDTAVVDEVHSTSQQPRRLANGREKEATRRATTMVNNSLLVLSKLLGHRHVGLFRTMPRGSTTRRKTTPRSSWWYDAASVGSWLVGGSSFPSFQHVDRKNTSCRSFIASKSSNPNITNEQPRKAIGEQHGERRRSAQRPPLPQRKQQRSEFLTVSDILDDYMQNHGNLAPYQVAAKWNHLGKAAQKSRKWGQQHGLLWIDHQASLQVLVDQTILLSADQFDGRSTATVTHSLVKILHYTGAKSLGAGERIRPLWEALLRRTARLLQSQEADGFNAHSLSNLIWAYAKATADGIIKREDDDDDDDDDDDGGRFLQLLLNDIAHQAELCVHDFAPQGLSNVAWGLATMNHNAPLVLDAISGAAQARIKDFVPQSLAISAWAFATLKHDAPLLLDAIAQAAQVRIHDFNPQDLATTAWSFATLKHDAPLLLDAIANAAQVRIHDFNPQELSNMICAYAKMNHHSSPEFLNAIARAAQVRINDFSPQELSNTAWAFATLKHKKAPGLFLAIARAAQTRIAEFNPQELSNTAWSFATVNHQAPSLLEAIANAAKGRINEFSPQELSNTSWAFATMKHDAPPSLLDAIANAAQERIHDFKPQELSNTALAFARLNRKVPLLLEAIAQAVQVQIHDFNEQALCNTAWSFAVFDSNANLFMHLDSPFGQSLQARDPLSFSAENIRQLHQVQLWCQEHTSASCFPDELSQRCREAFVSKEAAPSQWQNDVIDLLRTIQGVSHVEEEIRTKSGYIMDAVIVYRGNEIGVEVDGASHFVGRSQNPNGKTILKRRQVRALDRLKLVSVLHWEWNGINKGSSKKKSERQEQYLQNLLDEALVVSK